MNYWIIPSNEATFRMSACIRKQSLVDWKQRNNYEVGDIVFIYNSRPQHRIVYMMEVVRVNVPSSEYVNDPSFWIDELEGREGLTRNRFVRLKLLAHCADDVNLDLAHLRAKGLICNLQSSVRVKNEELLNYILSAF